MNSDTKKIWILSGEASGDLYGAALTRELHRLGKVNSVPVEVSGMGGPKMAQEDFRLLVDSTELGVIGVVEILKHIFTFIKIFFQLLRTARRERPDAVVLIDYPGFNLLFALAMYFSSIRVVWYVCPHLWVWGKWRLPVLAKICSKMLVIFPFECEVFAKTRLRAEFVGHPLADIVEARTRPELTRQDNLFLLLPGSRKMEIDRLLHPMLETICVLHEKHPALRFVLSAPREKVAARCQDIYEDFIRRHPECPGLEIRCGETAALLQEAGTGIAASGTVTVECALAGLPLVVVYKLNTVTLLLASLVVRLYRGFFTMTNIIADKEVYREYLQWKVKPKYLVPAIEEILPGGSRRTEVEKDMLEVKNMLKCGSSNAAFHAAEKVWEAASAADVPQLSAADGENSSKKELPQ